MYIDNYGPHPTDATANIEGPFELIEKQIFHKFKDGDCYGGA